jgi:hypothetical protein
MTFLKPLILLVSCCACLSVAANPFCASAFMTSKDFDFNVFGNTEIEIFKNEIKHQTGFTVVESAPLTARDALRVEGRVDPFSQRIFLLQTLRPVEKFFVLNHEKTHASFARNLILPEFESSKFWSTSIQLFGAETAPPTNKISNLRAGSNALGHKAASSSIDPRLSEAYSKAFLLEEVQAYYSDAILAYELLTSLRISNPRVFDYVKQFFLDSKSESQKLAEVSSELIYQIQFVLEQLIKSSSGLPHRLVKEKYKMGDVFFVEFAMSTLNGQTVLISIPVSPETTSASSVALYRYLLSQMLRAQTETKNIQKQLQLLNTDF